MNLKQLAINKLLKLAGSQSNETIFDETVNLVKKSGTVSFPKIMRHFNISYARARRLIDELEKAGILGPSKSDSEQGKILIEHGNDDSVWKNPDNR